MSEAIIQLSNGRLLDIVEPDPNAIDLDVLADGLARTCRFTGQGNAFYSVAEHSVLVARQLQRDRPGERPLHLWGLMHDAAEAFICDLPGPFKHVGEMHFYRHVEAKLLLAVADRFGLPWPPPKESIKAAEALVFSLEMESLFGKDATRRLPVFKTPQEAALAFRAAFHELTR